MMIYDKELGETRVEEETLETEEREVAQGGEVIELSMNSIMGVTTPQTMKLRGQIEG